MRQLKIEYKITNRNTSVEKYLGEISKTELIGIDEEIELCNQIKSGDKSAIDRLVKANLRFVISVAKQYAHNSDELADFIQAGNEGCIVAAERFDSTRGFKFISYAVWHIRQRILQHIGEMRTIRIPQHRINEINSLKKENELKMQRGITDSPKVINMAMASISLDSPLGDDDTLLDIYHDPNEVPIDENLVNEGNGIIIQNLFKTLDPRQRYIMNYYYGLDGREEKNMTDIAIDLKLTRERVRQLHNLAITKLRKKAPSIKELIKF